MSKLKQKHWCFTLVSTSMVLNVHLPRPEIRTPDLTVLNPKILSIFLGQPKNCNELN